MSLGVDRRRCDARAHRRQTRLPSRSLRHRPNQRSSQHPRQHPTSTAALLASLRAASSAVDIAGADVAALDIARSDSAASDSARRGAVRHGECDRPTAGLRRWKQLDGRLCTGRRCLDGDGELCQCARLAARLDSQLAGANLNIALPLVARSAHDSLEQLPETIARTGRHARFDQPDLPHPVE